MNKSYISKWNPALGSWVAVSELARGRRKGCRGGVLLSAVMLISSGQTAAQVVSVSGNYQSTNAPTASPWNAGTNLYVGNSGTGTLNVSGGGLVTNTTGALGQLAGSVGTAIVTGAGSTWTTTGVLTVANQGTGSMSVLDGGVVGTGTAFGVSTGANSNGVITVSGINANGTRSQLLGATSYPGGTSGTYVSKVGARGTGTLNVLDGALVSQNGFFYVGGSSSNGRGTVNVMGVNANGTPSSLVLPTSSLVELASGINSAGTLSILDGGSVRAGGVTVGAQGVGILTVGGMSTSGVASQLEGRVVLSGPPSAGNATMNIGAPIGASPQAPGLYLTTDLLFGSGVATLNFNHTSSAYTFATDISMRFGSGGTSTINQVAGTTILTGNSNGFRGTTNVTGGTLRVNGTLGNAASSISVSSGGTLGGSGTIGGSVTVADGILSPGNSPGTLTIAGNLALNAASQLNYELGAANTAGGALNDLTVVGGNLTLDGTLNVTQSAGGAYGPGIYRLIDYTGSLTDNGLDLGNMPAGTSNYVQTSVAHQVNLVNSNGLTLNWWDGDAGGRNDGVIAGGNGTWQSNPTSADRWTQADGLINTPYQNPSFAIFAGTPGTVTVDNTTGPVTVTGMQFSTSGYRIEGGDITLTAGTNAIRVGDGTAAGATTRATIASALTGAGRLDKVDLGTLVLSGENTYSGGTAISGGTLQLGEGGTTGSIVGGVMNDGTLAFNRSDAVTFTGAISGTGAVTQMGTGTTTLASANTYSGGTTISAGTLAGSAASFGSGAITDNAALVINQSVDATFANPINGSGSFTKTGSGALTLTSDGTLSGATSVMQGTLAVNGSLASSAVTVAGGATLTGAGAVGATTLQSGATIAPGNGLGTLSVKGNFTQAAGSTYQVQLDSSTKGTSDRIDVAGTASIGAGAVLNVARADNTSYALDSQYTVLSAAGGVSGTYTLTGDTRTAFVQIKDTYDANNVYLTAMQDRSFTTAGLTPNQVATAGGLDTLAKSSALRGAVAFLPSDAAARAAFDQLSGELHASVQTAMLDDSRFVREAANDQLLNAFCAPGASPMATNQANGDAGAARGCTPTQNNVTWLRAFGSTGRFEGDGNAQTTDRDIAGFFTGVDTSLANGWRVGGLTGYSHSDLHGNGAASSDDYHVGIYGGRQWDTNTLRLGASYTWHKLDSHRDAAFSGFFDATSASYNASTGQVFAELGHRFELNSGFSVEPFAGLAYVHVSTDDFAEKGGAAALRGRGSSLDTGFSTLGARLGTQLTDQTALRAMVGWRHAFGDTIPGSTNAFAGSVPFTVSAVPLAADTAVIEIGIEAQVRRNMTLSASYSGQFANKLSDNGIKVALNYKF